ncbi:PAC2 family protein [Mycetocola tolaasinivorans]|uniref:PAC2 family protein n=1 Tax=Mycetocola tolaasinivorans TaxID=76635 RepID=UPI001FE244B3|nr:PAC2 family protein [Mycetocola tolaasinivorans]
MNERVLVVAFEGWNDAGEAASGAAKVLRDHLAATPLKSIDPEPYYDFQFTRPTIFVDDSGRRALRWPETTFFAPGAASTDAEDVETQPAFIPESLGAHVSTDNEAQVYLLIGTEPSRSWQAFVSEVLDTALVHDIGRIIVMGSVLADAPHTRPIQIECTSDNADIRAELEVERSQYEGPVGILNVLCIAAEAVGIPTLSVWASVPHYVHNTPSPKAILALVDRIEELVGVVIPRGNLLAESAEWEQTVSTLTAEDPDMVAYIRQLEQARDTVEDPEASGEAIAREFRRFLDSAPEAVVDGPDTIVDGPDAIVDGADAIAEGSAAAEAGDAGSGTDSDADSDTDSNDRGPEFPDSPTA